MKQSVINNRSILILAIALFVAIGFTAILTTDVSQAKTKDKAVKVGMSFTGVSYESLYDGSMTEEEVTQAYTDNSYSVAVAFKNKLSLTSDMKASGTVYIPKKLLKANGSVMHVLPLVICEDSSLEKGWFSVQAKYVAIVSNTDGKVGVKLYEQVGENEYNEVPLGKMASLKLNKSKKYYVLKLNNIPMADVTSDGGKIPAGVKYETSLCYSLDAFGVPCGAFLYLDDVKLTAQKTSKITFNKKDYNTILPYRTMYQQHVLPYELAVVK